MKHQEVSNISAERNQNEPQEKRTVAALIAQTKQLLATADELIAQSEALRAENSEYLEYLLGLKRLLDTERIYNPKPAQFRFYSPPHPENTQN